MKSKNSYNEFFQDIVVFFKWHSINHNICYNFIFILRSQMSIDYFFISTNIILSSGLYAIRNIIFLRIKSTKAWKFVRRHLNRRRKIYTTKNYPLSQYINTPQQFRHDFVQSSFKTWKDFRIPIIPCRSVRFPMKLCLPL